ncbi:MipA/OmpV family protein [Nitrospirillum pindoramense]|uniref:Outer membrane protein n=1 Tax=Nitrospirillum amazonense TaxID=28077 RepID=A0A560HHR1_9PROT|nr:MipA/OmpV family protein [Nitrospirillum amazonense]TWB45129.1 outer membrane protein [Nitrospirillum amazonense]
MFPRKILIPVSTLVTAVASLLAAPAMAEDATAQPTSVWPAPVWDVSLGAGVAVRPTYEGSDRYQASPVPLFTVRYNDMLTMGPEGLSAYWHHGDFRVGAGLTFDPGRNDSKGNGLFNNGDDRLKGMGDVDKSLGFKVFGAYQLGRLSLDLSAVKYTGDQNDGVVVTGGVGLPLKLAERLTLTPHVGVSWASDSYMQAYFGVTPAQAAASRFAAYSAGAGFKDVSAGALARYRITDHWFVTGDVTVKRLLGDAADSPVTYAATSARAFAAVGYRF